MSELTTQDHWHLRYLAAAPFNAEPGEAWPGLDSLVRRGLAATFTMTRFGPTYTITDAGREALKQFARERTS